MEQTDRIANVFGLVTVDLLGLFHCFYGVIGNVDMGGMYKNGSLKSRAWRLV